MFKVGDKVLVKKSYMNCGSHWYKEGEILTVSKMTTARGYPAIEFKEYYGGLFAIDNSPASFDHFELIESGKEQLEVLPRLLLELEARKQKGLQTYGTTLKTNNGRSALRDALEESLDMSMYLMQAVMEEEQNGKDKV